MSQLRLALAQVDPTLGDLAGNAAVVRQWSAKAHEEGAHVVAFPEMMLTGYPVEDLALRSSFVEASRTALERLARDLDADGLGELAVVVGYLDRVDPGERNVEERPGVFVPKGRPQNTAAVIHRGQVVARYAKHHLPNYGVFDEFRIFTPGKDLTVIRIHGVDVAIVICEDIWQDGGPVALTRRAGAELLLVLNGSPYERDKDDVRRELVSRRAAEAGCTLAYVNMVGGQDDLVFDGDSIGVAADGRVLARAPQFEEILLVVDLDLPPDAAHDAPPVVDGVRHVIVSELPLPGYEPTRALVAPELETCDQLYRAVVLGLRDYVRKNGFRSVILGLSGGIDSTLVAAVACDAIGAANVVGYSTIYGDSVGGFNPVKDVPKTLIWQLARWRNAEAERRDEVPPIPENTITKAPSAELRPGQTDQDILPPYELLDP